MTRRDLPLIAALFLFAFGLRFLDVAYPPYKWMDERNNVAAGINYLGSGQFEPDPWEHPPLRNLTTAAFLGALGDNPYGWRMRNVLFGAAAAALTALLAFSATGSRRVALLAGALLATDPLHVVLSRFTFEEVYGGAFFLASIVLFVMHRRRSSWLLMSALLMGCALGTKWYFVPGWLLIFAAALWEDRSYRDPRTVLFLSSAWILIPLGVYLLAYYPWFGRGYRLGEFVEQTRNAYASLQSYTVTDAHVIDTRVVFQGHTSAFEWFLRPIILGVGTLLGPGKGEFIIYANSPPVWCLTLPAVVGVAVLALRRRLARMAYPAILFAVSYALFVLVDRPVFIYSAIPLLPFAFTAVAQGVSLVADRFGSRVFWAAAAILLAWNLYLYPLVTAKQVPLAPYAFLIERAEIEYH